MNSSRTLGAALALVATIGLAGCGSSSSEDTSSSEDASSSSDTQDSQGSQETEASESEPEVSQAQRNALKSFVQQGRPKVRQLIKTFEGVYSDIQVDAVPPGTVRYRYVFTNELNPDTAEKALEKQAPTLKSACETAIFPAMKQAGITVDPKVHYVYLNPDQAELWSYTCTQ